MLSLEDITCTKMLSEQEPETQDKNQTVNVVGDCWYKKHAIFFLLENSKEELDHLVQASCDVFGSGPEELHHYLLHNYLKSNLLVHGTNKFYYPLKEEQGVKMFNIIVNERLTRAKPV